MAKSKGSIIRRMKRQAMKESGITFSERMMESVRTGKPVEGVKFTMSQKKVIAEKA